MGLLREQLKKDPNSYSKFLRIQNYAIPQLEKIEGLFPTYTLHNKVHCKKVEEILDVFCQFVDDLEPKEAFYLLCSIHLHDIGMSARKFEWEPQKLKGFEIRKRHPERAYDFIQNKYRQIYLDEEDIYPIARICKGHSGADISSKEFEGRGPYRRLRLLTALLRLADELDVSSRRRPNRAPDPEIIIEDASLDLTPEEEPRVAQNPAFKYLSKVHLLRHYYCIGPILDIKLRLREIEITFQMRFAEGEIRRSIIEDIVFIPIIQSLEEDKLAQILKKEGGFRVEISPYLLCDFVKGLRPFPIEFVKTCFLANLIRRLSVSFGPEEYYRCTRPEGAYQVSHTVPFLCHDDVIISKTIMPARINPFAWGKLSNQLRDPERREHDRSSKDSSEKYWDIAIWDISQYVDRLLNVREKGITKEDNILARLDTIIEDILPRTKNGKFKTYFLCGKVDQSITSTPFQLKSTIYESRYSKAISGGSYERATQMTWATYQRLVEEVRGRFNIDLSGPQPEKNLSAKEAFDCSLDAFIQMGKLLHEHVSSSPQFSKEFKQNISEKLRELEAMKKT